jgi:lipid A disaccharide synthetase
LSSLFLLPSNSLTKHAEVTNLVTSSLLVVTDGIGMAEHANSISSSAQDNDFNHSQRELKMQIRKIHKDMAAKSPSNKARETTMEDTSRV